ncbi:MAG: hypothetical protein IJ386_06720 [Clostridia bacterium]|nr:hypothetical protein [Clostridia bacterium]
MKKTISILLASITLLSTLAACKSDSTEQESTSGATTNMDESNTPANKIDSTAAEEIQYYQNPILTANTKDAWSNYGFGDPFVMRFNGM